VKTGEEEALNPERDEGEKTREEEAGESDEREEECGGGVQHVPSVPSVAPKTLLAGPRGPSQGHHMLAMLADITGPRGALIVLDIVAVAGRFRAPRFPNALRR